jgi:lipid-A-disaccharide synthase
VVRLIDRSADTVLAAADAALVASGTATLQTLLYGCPMVVAYRWRLTALWRAGRLVKVRFCSHPNLPPAKAGAEFLREAVTPPAQRRRKRLEDTSDALLGPVPVHPPADAAGRAAKAAQCVWNWSPRVGACLGSPECRC